MSELIGEATILIRPDTSRFRAELEAALRATSASIQPLKVPVMADTEKMVAATEARSRVQRKLTQAVTSQEEATRRLREAEQAYAAIATAGELRVSELARRRAQLTAAISAQAKTERALTAVTQAGTQAQIAQATALQRTVAMQVTAAKAAALQAVEMARNASTVQATARAHSQLVSGARASALAMTGLRGPTLAASAAFLTGVVAVTALTRTLGAGLRSAADLERTLAVFRVTTQATAEEMERVAAVARALGSDLSLPGVTASGAADAMTLLAKAGLSVRDAMEGARGTLLLATAAQIDNAQATEIVASALNAFGLRGEEATRVADLLAAASNEAQGSITDMGVALSQVASVSRQVGLSVEDTVALLSLLARNGILGSSAGTVLRVALLRLVNPSREAAQVIERLGLKIRDAQGNVRPEVFAEFAEATKDLTAAQRDAAAAEVFGVRGIRAQAILGREGARALRAMREEVTKSDKAQELATAQTVGLSGAIENLKNQSADFALTLGNLLKGPSQTFINDLALLIKATNLAVQVLADAADRADLGSKLKDDIVAAIPAFRVWQLEVAFLRKLLGETGKEMEDAGQKLRDELSPALKETTVDTRGLAHDTADAASRMVEFQRAGHDLARFLRSEYADAVDRAKLRTQELGKAFVGLRPGEVIRRMEALDERTLTAKIAGDPAKVLAELRRRRAFLERQLEREVVKRRPALRRRLKSELLATIQEIEAIEEEQANEAREAAEKAARAREERYQKILDAFSARVQAQRNAIIATQMTETLADDLAASRKQRRILREIIRSGKLRAEDLADFRRDLVQVNVEIDRLLDAIREERKRAAREQRARIRERLELDIEFASIVGNRRAEINARERLIAALKREQALVKRGTNAWRELRNAIAREREEIRKLRGEQDRRVGDFKQMAFEFLREQAGFVSTLASNVIPVTGALPRVQLLTADPFAGLRERVPRGGGIAALALRAGGGQPVSQAQGTDIIAELRALNRRVERLLQGLGHSSADVSRKLARSGSGGQGGSGLAV